MTRYEEALKELEDSTPYYIKKYIKNNTNPQFTRQYHRYENKRTNIIRNRQMIEACEQILTRHTNEGDHHEFNTQEIERFKKILDRMCNGLNLTFTQFLFLISYGKQSFISP
jgi:hypothetical protein